MLIDMHVHEKTYSSDSLMSLEEIIEQGKQLGLDAVCITDHDSNGLKEAACQISREKNFRVFVGAEILTLDGDVLVFGIDHIDRFLTGEMHAHELVSIITRLGGAAISAHPYRQNGRGMGDIMGDKIRRIVNLSGIEGFNGSTPFHLNVKACQVAMEMKLPIFGSSDAHHLEKLGKYATLFPDGIRDEKDFVEAILEGNVEPVYYLEGSYHKFVFPADMTYPFKMV